LKKINISIYIMNIQDFKQFNYYLKNISNEFNGLIEGGKKDFIKCHKFAEKSIHKSFEDYCVNHNKKDFKGGANINFLDELKKKLDKLETRLEKSNIDRLKNLRSKMKKLREYIVNNSKSLKEIPEFDATLQNLKEDLNNDITYLSENLINQSSINLNKDINYLSENLINQSSINSTKQPLEQLIDSNKKESNNLVNLNNKLKGLNKYLKKIYLNKTQVFIIMILLLCFIYFIILNYASSI
tara:strand:+ start:3957 stop:4679 length:723 start_codon:yes stop_codon:yes gene_type:complete